MDPVRLTADLIRCASVTPEDRGALAVLEAALAPAGFVCTRVRRGGIENLHARWGPKGHALSFGYGGHTDVVPPGPEEVWRHPPFAAEIAEGAIWGRGAADMKSSVAAFVAAAVEFVTTTPPDGAVVLVITGDEEGPAEHGTRALIDWMRAEGEVLSACLVGEPTCPETFGDMIKIGRRGSFTARITAQGRQGHSAYPQRAANPLPVLVRFLDRVASHELDRGTDHFDPSTLALTTIDTGNPANNVIPGTARATLNIRFNDRHSAASLAAWLEDEARAAEAGSGVTLLLETSCSGEAFLTPPGALSTLVSDAVEAETGIRPALSTSGGTSDARFLKDLCPVVEFGLVGQTMHQVDEHVPVAQIEALTRVYGRILRDYFA